MITALLAQKKKENMSNKRHHERSLKGCCAECESNSEREHTSREIKVRKF
jgi:hypothetical protein